MTPVIHIFFQSNAQQFLYVCLVCRIAATLTIAHDGARFGFTVAAIVYSSFLEPKVVAVERESVCLGMLGEQFQGLVQAAARHFFNVRVEYKCRENEN